MGERDPQPLPDRGPDRPDDRIDFVLARGEDLGVEDAAIVGEGSPQADVVVTPWPSDHRASSATLRF